MNPFDHNFFLGYVNSVSPQIISIHFPSSNLLKRFSHNGINYAGGNVGQFVVVEGEEYGFLARLIKVYLPDSEKRELNEKEIEQSSSKFHPSGDAEILLTFKVHEPKITYKTVSKYPKIGAKVFSCSDDQIKAYVKEFGRKDDDNIFIELGKLSNNDAECYISLNSLIGRHCAIVGTTGGGKSWTVAKIIEEINKNSQNKVVLIDATGEYETLTSNSVSVGMDTFFHHKYLTNADLCFLFRENSPNTVAALIDAVNSLKLIHLGKISNGIKVGKKIIDVQKSIRDNASSFHNCDYDFTQLAVQIVNEGVKEGKSEYQEDQFKIGYCSHLISRINSLLFNPIFKTALGIGVAGKKDLIVELSNFLTGPEKILRIGFEKLPYDFAIRELTMDFISKFLLIKARNGDFQKSPAVLFIDEAHQFLDKRVNTDDNSIFSLSNVDLIAKECRKYGLFLCLATQMPKDIPAGTLSQMGSFIVHRLINEQDKRAVENAATSANRSVLSFLPALGEGEAILVGVEFPMPLLIKIGIPSNPPNSNTPRFIKI